MSRFNYNFHHNQLSADNPFRFIGASNNSNQKKELYPKQNELSPSKEDNKEKSNLHQHSLSINEKGKRDNSQNCQNDNFYYTINSRSYAKNSRQNYQNYRQNKDHIAELFNSPIKAPQDYYSGNTTNQNALQLPYSTYTANKQRKDDKDTNEIFPYIKNEKISNIELEEYYVESNNLIKNYAYKENPNLPFRQYMEDKGISILNINGDPDKALFCLFDGHGGDQVSKFLQKNFLKYFKEIILPSGKNNSNINDAFTKLFKTLDEKIKEFNYTQIGSTACIIYITNEKGRKILYSANIGDTRALLISKNEYQRLTYEHRASDSNEYKRIINGGGIVLEGRIYGSLMLSRAFGDWEFKNYGLICEPFINERKINDNDKYVIIATDGVWDSLNDDDVYEISKDFDNSKELCNYIVKKSAEKFSMDNISCFVIKL